MHSFGNDRLTVTVKADGAEPVSIRTPSGLELLWQAGPQWPRHAPVLFPIVGRLRDDTLHEGGRSYRLTQHGFARDRRFDWAERTATGCRLTLVDDEASRAMFPYPFAFDILYDVEGDRLRVTYVVRNTGTATLPASVGAHPAFRWPLVEAARKEDYRLTFDTDEPAPIRRVSGGLLRADPEPTPIEGRTLHLSDALFTDDAVILDRLASGSVTYGATAGPSLVVDWHGMTQLGIWSKPGADFVCIEPWHGLASPAGFEGEFHDKPFLMLLQPGETREVGWSVAVAGAD